MKTKAFRWAAPTIAVLVLAAVTGAWGETPKYIALSGTINDYTPQANPPALQPVVAGPWEVRGHWTLVVNRNSGKADFSAELTMERSDQGVIANGNDFNNPAIRKAHTHHIHMSGTATFISGVLQVQGPAMITVSGAFPPPFGPNVPLTVQITGGNAVPFSNIAVAFGSPADTHFGTAPLHGVVRRVE
ncbi:MAG: hypothetical protein WAM66_10225 [Acidobacteriaceae bacterium]